MSQRSAPTPDPGRRIKVVMASPDPRDPGGIVTVISSWRAAGLGELVDLVELPTSRQDSPLWQQLLQAGRALLRLGAMLVGRSRPDLVHLHASTGGSLLRKLVLGWACRAARVPYVAHMHSGAIETWVRSSPIKRAAARSLFSGSAAAIVLAERWRECVQELGASRVIVLPNGLSAVERATLLRCRELRSAPADRDGRPTLLFYGRWHPIKGVDRIAEALRVLPARDYELHLWGNGDRAWLERQFEGIAGEVGIGGWLNGERKLAELARADVLLVPSRSEGFGISVIEARAAGVPVIASDAGAMRETLAGYPLAVVLAADDDRGLQDAIARVLARRWPSGQDPGELPKRLWTEPIIERLVSLYRETSGG